MDCPTCNGSGYEAATATWLPHANFGDENCPGFLYGIADSHRGYIFCIECDAIVREVPANELQGTLTEMELTLDSCAEQCPHCKSVNLIVGFSRVFACTCKNCGRPFKLIDE